MKVEFLDEGWDDYLYWQTQDRKTIKRINTLIADCGRNGSQGLGKPEPLQYEWAGWFSRRINEADRLVYKIEGDTVVIAQCRTHYGQH